MLKFCFGGVQLPVVLHKLVAGNRSNLLHVELQSEKQIFMVVAV